MARSRVRAAGGWRQARGARSPAPPQDGGRERAAECYGRGARRRIQALEVAGGIDGIRWEVVGLGLVEQQEERAHAADAVVIAGAVEPRFRQSGVLQLGEPMRGALAQV